MTEDKGILIKNIYYMLAYAFQILHQSDYEELAAEDFDNIYDMFAAILGKSVARQLKQGLYCAYVDKTEDLHTLRGKLDMSGTLRKRQQQKQVLTCVYDELSENNIFNQILKTTMFYLLKKDNIPKKRRTLLKKNLLLFGNVDILEPSSIRWNLIRFQRNNQSYRVLMHVCHLVLDGLLLSTDKGNVKWATFIDEQRMCRLYEKFILEYYRYHHPQLRPCASQIPWDLDDAVSDFLPVMQTDITLYFPDEIRIIDAKYYAHTMQNYYDTQTIHSNNLYQIYTYVKNLDKKHTGKVSGMLLYAKTKEQIQPNQVYSMGGNQIIVKTLDLNRPFSEIVSQLEEIARTRNGDD